MIYLIYCLYVILSAVILFFLSKGQTNAWFFKLIIVSFLPIFGWFIPSIWPKKWIKYDEQFFSQYMKDQSEDITIQLLQSRTEVARKQELNVISIEEALLINDFSTRRRVLIDILKQDAMQYIDVLKTAVTNEDTETSHYAVTAIIEVKRELTILMQKLAVEYAQNPNDSQLAQAYADVIKAFLRSGFLDAQSTKQYQVTYIQVLDCIIKNGHATEKTYTEKITMELAIKDLASAEMTAAQFKANYPLCEDAYLLTISLYFTSRAFDKLTQELELLKAAPITLSNHALTIVRYWNGVNRQHEAHT